MKKDLDQYQDAIPSPHIPSRTCLVRLERRSELLGIGRASILVRGGGTLFEGQGYSDLDESQLR